MLYIIGVVFLIIIIFIIVLNSKNKNFKFQKLKIDEAQNSIKLYLNKKYKLIKKCRLLIKKELKLKNFLKDIDEVNPDNLNTFQFHDFLSNLYNELFTTIDDNEKLYKSEEIMKLVDEINDNEDDLYGSIKYYNDTVVDYNHLILTFPSNIVKLFFGYKKKEFYKREKREIFKILKEDKN